MTGPAPAAARAALIREAHAELLRAFGSGHPEADAALTAACLGTTAHEVHRALGRAETESNDAD